MCRIAGRVKFRSRPPVDGPGRLGHCRLATSGLDAALGHIPGRGR